MSSTDCKVIMCGTGGVGGGALREAIRLPWMDVVGVQVYSDEKAGVDAGELVGMAPIGVITTTDPEEIDSLQADCVVYCARDFGDWRTDDVFVRFLESGKNVVTSLAYFRADSRDADARERLMAACRRGGTSLYATGINPGYIGERLSVILTGISHDIERIKVEEFFDVAPLSKEIVQLIGVGLPVEESRNAVAAANLANLYLQQTIALICDELGVEIDSIEPEQVHATTETEIETVSYTVAAGNVGSVTNRWVARVEGRPFLLYETTWFAGKTMQPEHSETEHNWLVTIEGRPSLRMLLEVNASMETGASAFDGDPTPAGYYATAIPLIQAIPWVCESAPGILGPPSVGPHWTGARGRSAAVGSLSTVQAGSA